MELDKEKFIELVEQDVNRAFNMLVNNYASMVFNVCLNLIRNREDAEDVTQEVFTSVYLSMNSYEGKSKLSTWIYSISLNKSKEFLRSKTRKKRSGIMTQLEKDESHFLPEAIIETAHPGVLLENKERTEILFAAVDQLAENQRLAYTMHKIEGLSYDEIGTIMDLSKSSVESLMFRAKNRLKQLLENYYEKNER